MALEPVLHHDDEDLLSRFGRQQVGKLEWTHETHIRVGWLHLKHFGAAESVGRLRDGIRKLNTANGVVNGPSSGYHETLTRVWIRLIKAADAGDPPTVDCSSCFVERHPELLEVRLPLRFYTRDRITSEQARAAWVEPDLHPLP